ncbi:hypothetical protein [Peribacillus muralis]|nr:hypothetical protein [Peribacillus muralis]
MKSYSREFTRKEGEKGLIGVDVNSDGYLVNISEDDEVANGIFK